MITVNAMGENCPIPVIKTKKALAARGSDDTVLVLVDNEIAVQNVSKLGVSEGAEVSSEKVNEKEYKVTLKLTGEAAVQASGEAVPAPAGNTGDAIVVVSSDRMGEGNDELGKVLMKGFIFAVSQLDELPKQVIFYNGGATLPCEGSDSLADIKSMEEQGVEILTCGTCLDYYQLKDKLAAGSVTNMYAIVEAMQGAGKILKP